MTIDATFKKHLKMKNKEAIDLLDEIYKLQDAIIKKANTELISSGVDLSIKIALRDIVKLCGITQDKAINVIHKLTTKDETL